MKTALDSNVVIALWSESDALNLEAMQALDGASGRGGLVICAPVYLEVRAFPSTYGGEGGGVSTCSRDRRGVGA